MIDEADKLDPRGLIRESYRIEGITVEECRSIFMDWALGVPGDADTGALIAGLLQRHGGESDHPMTAILREGQGAPAVARRRGGRAGRRG